MILHDVVQGSPEWHKLRRGIPTASEAEKLVTPTGELSSQIEGYARLLAAEMAGAEIEHYESAAMARGKQLEADGRAQYSFEIAPVVEVGFCTTDDSLFGCSPDGLVGEDGGIEIKYVGLAKWLGFLAKKEYPKDWHPQIQANLMVTRRNWWDLVLPYPGLRLQVYRVLPDPAFIAKLESQRLKVISKRDQFARDFLLAEPTQPEHQKETTIEF